MSSRTIVYDPHKTIPLSDFRDELEFEFPNLPAGLFEHYLVKTAIDMAVKANVIRRWVAIELQPCVTRYLLVPPDNLQFHAVTGIRLSHHGSLDCDAHVVRRSFTPPDGCECLASGVAWLTPDDQVLHFSSCQCGILYVSMSVKPERGACELPQEYQGDLYDTLLMGTRASLLLLTGRKWTNMRVGAELFNEYERMLSRKSVSVALRGQRGIAKMNFGRIM